MLRALVGMPDGSVIIRASGSDERGKAYELGRAVAGQLLSNGGDSVLAQFNPGVLKPPGA